MRLWRWLVDTLGYPYTWIGIAASYPMRYFFLNYSKPPMTAFELVGGLTFSLIMILFCLTREVKAYRQRILGNYSPAPSRQRNEPQNTSELERRLVGLLYGDREKALRLVRLVRAKYPRASAAWCWEKAIEELISDRSR